MTELPSHISHYEIVRVLGQGGMGTVYLAVDPALRRQVALKVLRADSADQRERFRREARIVARLQHPNIVAIYAVGEHEHALFIAMEHIDGEPLSDAIRRRAAWGLHRKLQMAADLCAGLAFAHRNGVIHRDVKPSNLMVANGTGTLRLLDFGIARGADPGATLGLTMHGNIVGTLNYMSPEQITGQALDHRSDIFAVGLVLYELLAYRQAFPGDNLATLTYRIVHGGADPLQQVQPDLDPELCAVVDRAMARAPDDRYPHLEAMRTDLLRVAARLSPEAAAGLTPSGAAGTTPASGHPLIWSRALDPTVEASGPATPHSTARVPGGAADAPEERHVLRRPLSLAAGVGSAIAAGVLAAWVGGGLERETPPPEPTPARPVTSDERPLPASRTREAPTTPPVADTRARPELVTAPTPRPSGTGDAPPAEAAQQVPRVPRTSPQAAAASTPPTLVVQGLPPSILVEPGAAPAPSGLTGSREPGPPPPAPSAAGGGAPSSPAPGGPDDEARVQATLERWAKAYGARDARGVEDVQPGLGDTLEKQFAALRTVDVALSGCRVAVQDTRATATCQEQFSAEMKVGGQRTSDTRRRQFSLEKSATGAWRITSARIVR